MSNVSHFIIQPPNQEKKRKEKKRKETKRKEKGEKGKREKKGKMNADCKNVVSRFLSNADNMNSSTLSKDPNSSLTVPWEIQTRLTSDNAEQLAASILRRPHLTSVRLEVVANDEDDNPRHNIEQLGVLRALLDKQNRDDVKLSIVSVALYADWIKNIEMMTDCPALESLVVAGNLRIRDIAPLSSCPKLKHFAVKPPLARTGKRGRLLRRKGTRGFRPRMELEDVSVLAGCPDMETICVSFTSVWNIAPLANLTALRSLNISYTGVANLPAKCRWPNLEEIDISFTDISTISPLLWCRKLRVFNARATRLSNINPLGACTALERVDISATEVEDITALSRCIDLEWVHMISTNVSDISPLVCCPKLKLLNIDECDSVRNLSALDSGPKDVNYISSEIAVEESKLNVVRTGLVYQMYME